MKRASLQIKFLFSVGCIVLLVLGASTLLHIRIVEQYYLEAITWRSEGLAQGILDRVEALKNYNPLYKENAQALLEKLSVQCKNLYELNKGKNIAHLAVYNPDGVVAAHNAEDLLNTSASAGLLAQLERQQRSLVLDDGLYHILIPILDDDTYLGTIDIGVPQELVNTKSRQLLMNTAGLFVLFLTLSIGAIWLLTNMIVIKPVLKVSDLAQRLAHLDLMVQVENHRRDEIGTMFQALKDMVESFKHVITQVQRSGIQVTSSSAELATTAKQQEVTISTQMDGIQRMVQSVQEIAQVAKDLVQTMQQVAFTSEETAEFASSGQVDLAHMHEAMAHMEQASAMISSRLEAINVKAENITTVVTTINKVADQTNLLSLNASIEAEKAGEYGRGFTVVAREIRRLADQTATATFDIEHMVKEMQSAVSAGVMEMDKFIAEVRHSTEDVERISTQLTRIIEQVQSLSPRFEETTAVTNDQAEHAHNIERNMLQLSQEMQQTSQSLRESFLAIEQLNEAARNLQAEVSRFKVG